MSLKTQIDALATAIGADIKATAAALTAAIGGKQPLDSDLTAIAAIAPANDDVIQRKAGAWINRTIAQLKADLGLTGTNSGDQAIPSDFVMMSHSGVRATGIGDLAVAQAVVRAFTLTKVVYQFDTPDASGSTTVETRRNGAQVASSSVAVTAANQADGSGTESARTVTVNQSFAVGDRITPWITGIGTTPGRGLRAYYFGTWN